MLEHISAKQHQNALRSQSSTDCTWRVDGDRQADNLDLNRIHVLIDGSVRGGGDLDNVDCRQLQLIRGILVNTRHARTGVD